MLGRLSVKNYALIESLDLIPGSGLNIITGETGAGKSIMLGALSLLLGERVDSKVIGDAGSKSVIEASFIDVDDETISILSNLDVDYDGGELIVRREILPSGRSRNFINDSPVRLSDLATVTSRLVDIHSQHSNQMLSTASRQLEIVDIMSENDEILADYRNCFHQYVSLHRKLKSLKEDNEKMIANRMMYEYQLDQLDKLNPKAGELEAVEKRYDLLSDAEEIRSNLDEALYLIGGGEDGGVLARISDVEACLKMVNLELFEGKREEESLLDRIQQLKIELKDILETVEKYSSEIESNPEELARVAARMNRLYEANRLFKISETDGLVKLHRALKEKLAAWGQDKNDTVEFERQLRSLAHDLKLKGEALSESRLVGSRKFSQRLMEVARPLGLPNIRFEVAINSDKLTRNGKDKVEFMCSFNKNMALSPMTKVASGGEISRLMLSIKSIVAGANKQPTIIFDEIDTGVSGEIADKMGGMMLDMSERMQVITITHLPQVAAKGERHFKVYKKDTEERTISGLRALDENERIMEIAGMLSGEIINQAALDNAEELLNNRR